MILEEKLRILSNVEFEKLVEGKSPRLRAIAKKRTDEDPQGFLEIGELDRMIQMFAYSGDSKSTKWLKNLGALAKKGEIKKAREATSGADAWKFHAMRVARLHKNGEVAFGLFDRIQLKETGKRGMVVDYLPEDKKYIVALNPFEIRTYEKKDLEKVAKKLAQWDIDVDEVIGQLMNNEGMYWTTKEMIERADSPRELSMELEEVFGGDFPQAVEWHDVARELMEIGPDL